MISKWGSTQERGRRGVGLVSAWWCSRSARRGRRFTSGSDDQRQLATHQTVGRRKHVDSVQRSEDRLKVDMAVGLDKTNVCMACLLPARTSSTRLTASTPQLDLTTQLGQPPTTSNVAEKAWASRFVRCTGRPLCARAVVGPSISGSNTAPPKSTPLCNFECSGLQDFWRARARPLCARAVVGPSLSGSNIVTPRIDITGQAPATLNTVQKHGLQDFKIRSSSGSSVSQGSRNREASACLAVEGFVLLASIRRSIRCPFLSSAHFNIAGQAPTHPSAPGSSDDHPVRSGSDLGL
ncbi:hypothetical protein HDK77DRAFT_36864 [Phyllosticta capitalensis]|uniref:Uncharacterized protein n=1 Tax=Phyllosticta capitalensis TaxID=121624 RepID=A0ABR1Z1U9_9PEZI